MGAFSLFENLHKAKYCCSLSVKKFCLEQFLLNDFCYKQFLLKNLLSCFTMYSILEKAMWTIVAALLLTLSDGAPGWYPTEAPTTEDLAPEDPMTTTGTWQREAFKVVGDAESAGTEGDDVAVELSDNMEHTTVAVDAKQNEVLPREPVPSASELALPADREKDFLPKMTFPDIPTEDDLS